MNRNRINKVKSNQLDPLGQSALSFITLVAMARITRYFRSLCSIIFISISFFLFMLRIGAHSFRPLSLAILVFLFFFALISWRLRLHYPKLAPNWPDNRSPPSISRSFALSYPTLPHLHPVLCSASLTTRHVSVPLRSFASFRFQLFSSIDFSRMADDRSCSALEIEATFTTYRCFCHLYNNHAPATPVISSARSVLASHTTKQNEIKSCGQREAREGEERQN